MQTDVGNPEHLLIMSSTFAGRSAVEAVRPADGLMVWAYDLGQEMGTVIAGQGVIYLSTPCGHRQNPDVPARITALRAVDGTEIWRTDPDRVEHRLIWLRLKFGLQAYLQSFSIDKVKQVIRGLRLSEGLDLCIAGNTTLLGETDSTLYAFDTRDGDLRWAAPVYGSPIPSLVPAGSDRFYAPREWRGVEAVQGATGKAIWSSTEPQYAREVVASDAAVYVIDRVSNKAAITTLRATDGSVVGSYSLRSGRQDETQLVKVTPNGTAYLLRDHRLAAIRLQDQHELWSSQWVDEILPSSHGWSTGGAALECGERRVTLALRRFFPTSSTLHVATLDPDSGEVLWHWQTPETVTPTRGGPSLIATPDMLYIRNHDSVYALAARGGHLIWKMPASASGRLLTVAIPAE
jgi:outer membrane protein assembly factor BamB